ncbi:KH domain-containing protein [Candidatus Collierbacteria bacterium]|nr:KH domain-containing protein [Candidatus Collierbacteria bacterium]
MKELLEYIIPNIVNHPEDVVISETESEGTVNLSIKVNPEDMGRVIGKSGKVIKAIRQIGRIIAIKRGVRVNIDVVDEGKEPAA